MKDSCCILVLELTRTVSGHFARGWQEQFPKKSGTNDSDICIVANNPLSNSGKMSRYQLHVWNQFTVKRYRRGWLQSCWWFFVVALVRGISPILHVYCRLIHCWYEINDEYSLKNCGDLLTSSEASAEYWISASRNCRTWQGVNPMPHFQIE